MADFITGTGQRVTGVHAANQCAAGHCPIHNPSSEAERIGRTHWRNDRGLMERICAHGVGHPDPDHVAHVESRWGQRAARVEAIHGCDGCCRPQGRGKVCGLRVYDGSKRRRVLGFCTRREGHYIERGVGCTHLVREV